MHASVLIVALVLSGPLAPQQPADDADAVSEELRNCIVTAMDDVMVSANELGLLRLLDIREGVTIEKDQLLAQIDESDALLRKEAAEAQLAAAQEDAELNGIDDDEDGWTDYPFDPGCDVRGDRDETDPAEPTTCLDGQDNDGDGLSEDDGEDSADDFVQIFAPTAVSAWGRCAEMCHAGLTNTTLDAEPARLAKKRDVEIRPVRESGDPDVRPPTTARRLSLSLSLP